MMLLAPLLMTGWGGSDQHHVHVTGAQTRIHEQWVTLARADFDGDRNDDLVLGQKTTYPDAYGPRILVRTTSGDTLLELSDESLFYLVTVAPWPSPILVVGSPDGNWLRVQAFMFRPQTRKMQTLKWDHRGYVRGREVQVDPTSGVISMWTEGGKMSFRFKDGVLRTWP